MRAERLLRATSVKTHPAGIRPYVQFTSGWRCSTGFPTSSSHNVSVSSLRSQCRGVKTKTMVKANTLLQGVLPPLPMVEPDESPAKSYPSMLQQHLNNIRKFNDCVVLTRVGDFYELYFEQVDQYAHLVNLKKAVRKTALGDVAMAGFQQTQLDRYLKIFVQDHGLKVAISEQIRIPQADRINRTGAPMFDRRVTRVITAGTLIDETFMDPYENNFLLAVYMDASAIPSVTGSQKEGKHQVYEITHRTTKVGLSWVDLSSGDFYTQPSTLAALPSLVARIGPREVTLDVSIEPAGHDQCMKILGEGGFSLHFHRRSGGVDSVADWTPMLERLIPEEQHGTFTDTEREAAALVLDYVKDKLRDGRIQLQPPIRRSENDFMAIDKQSLRGLEIRNTLRDNHFQGSLLHAVRHTVTKSGARLLSQRLVSPSMSIGVINSRLDLVQILLEQDTLREDIIALLRQTSDIFRLLQRFSISKGDADDLLGLARTIDVMAQVSRLLEHNIVTHQDRITNSDDSTHNADYGFLLRMLDRFDLDNPTKTARAIQVAIDEEGLSRKHTAEDESRREAEDMVEAVITADSAGVKGPKLAQRASKSKVASSENAGTDDIWIMRRNASPTLERAHADLEKLLQAKADLTTKLRSELQSESVALKWSAQLGHFCHLKGKGNMTSSLPSARVIGSTKSTQSFYLSDWTHLGVRIDDGRQRIRTEEERVFSKLRAQVIENLMKLRRNAAVLDELDVACSSAVIAKERNLVRPIIHEGTSHNIVGGRHPTVDVGLREAGRLFTANDCAVGDASSRKIYLITGPNMAGKSTYLRQNALITILAQTGCFVPADYAEIGLVDKIFSRVGSADSLHQDQSTFMVEMLETAEILKSATPRSFVIMDEVGRGTTPEDGVAVGYACLHHLHNINQSRTLFATHFHALADMTKGFRQLGCYCTDVAEESDGSWAYVHRLRPGVNRKSHALKVARLAGIPDAALQVAAEVLNELPQGSTTKCSGFVGTREPEIGTRRDAAVG
nr:muts protein like 1 [Quercus suber]